MPQKRLALNITSLSLLVIISGAIWGCGQKNSAPRPYGYHRIHFPDKAYQPLPDSFPYFFEYPVYGSIVPDTSQMSEPYWIDIHFPKYKGNIHLSYKKIQGDLTKYMEEAREMAYKHSLKAEGINEEVIYRQEDRVFGIFYDIQGNAASAAQFFLTDSSTHFLRGALYFTTQSNRDSLRPAIRFFKEDMRHLIKTANWK